MAIYPGQVISDDHGPHWIAIKNLGKGSFGDLWLGEERETKDKVAIKFERRDHPNPQLPLEYQRYRTFGDSEFVPHMYKFLPVHGTDYHAIVMELLSRSLENLLNICDRTFSLKTTLQLAIQMVTIMQFIHNKRIVHRDIKPENFMFGRKELGKEKKLMIIDFGLSKEYFESDKHIKFEMDKPIMGTMKFMSINAHGAIEQTRRDDLESIGYMLIYFLNGKLPWKGIHAEDPKEQNKLIADKKRSMTPDKLVKGHPKEFGEYLKKVRSLKFAQDPNYEELRNLFKHCADHNHITLDSTYDWDDKVGEVNSYRIKKETKSNMKQRGGRGKI